MELHWSTRPTYPHRYTCSGPLRSYIDNIAKIFFSWLVILWYLQCEEEEEEKNKIKCTGQSWSGSLHWINCLVWPNYCVLYFQIKTWKYNWRENSAWSLIFFSFFLNKLQHIWQIKKIPPMENMSRTQNHSQWRHVCSRISTICCHDIWQTMKINNAEL